jgi:uncharacterized protein (TIGR00730 family)
MSKFLRDLLDAEEPVFSLALKQLETATGNEGVDAKLVGDITKSMHDTLGALRLDDKDVTGQEAYAALLARIADDNERVTKLIGGTDSSNVRELVPLMIAAAEKASFNRTVWVLKHESAKRLLRQMPPENLIKHLGYTDVEELLEKERFGELYTALRFSEGPEWLNNYDELFKTVTPADYEERDIEIIAMDHDKYVDLATHFVEKKLHNITHTKELGVIVVVPMHATSSRGLTLKSLPLLFHYMNEVKLYSTFFKLKRSQPNFGEIVVNTLVADPGTASQMAGQYVHWRVIQRYFGKLRDEAHPEAFEPHVQPEDLHWRRAEDLLFELDSEMAFWKDRDWVGLQLDGRPVTANVIDVSLSYANDISYDDRYVYHFRESLWNEIFIRYMGYKNLETQVLGSLDNNAVSPELLRVGSDREFVHMPVPKLKQENAKNPIALRTKLIDAAEGRLRGVVDEFEAAFDVLSKYDRTVTIFGSARLPQDDPVCQVVYSVACRLSEEGYAIVTGGGHGVMEAANHGASDAGGASIGLNIKLPHEQQLNQYATDSFQFEHFFARKVSMTLDASGYIYFPGGFGTLDELTEIITLEQTGKIPKVPIILFGRDFWQPFDAFIRSTLDDNFHTISPGDEALYMITDDIDEAVALINAAESADK